MVYICIYELCFLFSYCICIIHACSSLVEEIKNINIVISLCSSSPIRNKMWNEQPRPRDTTHAHSLVKAFGRAAKA